jgi:hypothetical protein
MRTADQGPEQTRALSLQRITINVRHRLTHFAVKYKHLLSERDLFQTHLYTPRKRKEKEWNTESASPKPPDPISHPQRVRVNGRTSSMQHPDSTANGKRKEQTDSSNSIALHTPQVVSDYLVPNYFYIHSANSLLNHALFLYCVRAFNLSS